MSSNFSIDGLVSGLNTSQIIDQLMQLESRPQTLMKERLTKFQNADSAYSSIRGMLTTLRSSTSSLGSLIGWEKITATTSDDKALTTSATSAAATGAIGVRVMSLASKQVLASSSGAADTGTTSIVAPGTQLTIATSNGGSPVGSTTITVGGTGTLDDVITAINSQSDVGVTAAAVQVGPGNFKLQIAAGNDGETITADFSALGLGSWIEVSPARNAVLRVGPDGSSYDITSTTNTFAGVLPGLTVTAKVEDPAKVVTVGTSRDVDGISKDVQKMVDGFNAVIAEVRKQTKYDAATKKASPLTGESAVRQLSSALSSAVIGDASSTPSLVGITLEKDGTLKFDAAKFKEAVGRDPVAAQRLFTEGAWGTGLAARLQDAIESAMNAETGYLTTAQKVMQTGQTDLQASIDQYQVRLDKRQLALRSQFSTLESTLGGLRSQQNWLSSQLSSLG